MPWHAGGPHELTIREINEYRRQMHDALREQKREADKARRKRR